jgi:hypothetical protein
MFYLDMFYCGGGYRRVHGLSSAQCHLRSRRGHLCFDAFSAREAERAHHVRRKDITGRDRESGNGLSFEEAWGERCS